MRAPSKPTKAEIDTLTAYLPILYADDFSSIRQWKGGARDDGGNSDFPWPAYDSVVSEFFRAAGAHCWLDCDYKPSEAAEMLDNEDLVRNATLDQIRTMLTYCVRGERFCDGHWATMIRAGHIRRLLERLVAIRSDAT